MLRTLDVSKSVEKKLFSTPEAKKEHSPFIAVSGMNEALQTSPRRIKAGMLTVKEKPRLTGRSEYFGFR